MGSLMIRFNEQQRPDLQTQGCLFDEPETCYHKQQTPQDPNYIPRRSTCQICALRRKKHQSTG